MISKKDGAALVKNRSCELIEITQLKHITIKHIK